MVDAYGLDTTFLIDVLRGNPKANELATHLSKEYLCTTHINVYELLLGFYSGNRDLGPLLESARTLFNQLILLPLSETAVQHSAQIGGFLNRKGWKNEHIDCLIAGTLLANGCTTIITRNTGHFKRIPGLKVKTY